MALAARAQRDLDTGAEAITNSEERAQVRRQARKVHIESLVAAALLTALSLIIPKPGSKGVYRLPTNSFAVWIKGFTAGEEALVSSQD